ncbi:MAG: TIGR03915 family putative DNA repair protein [Treponema sp.]|jgi:probable DNA metabolism protein|nr:TIGR03915 family putative DNA repair protein [Treponema sp.]
MNEFSGTVFYDGTLEGLFSVLGRAWKRGRTPAAVLPRYRRNEAIRDSPVEGSLFESLTDEVPAEETENGGENDTIGEALFELSCTAHEAFVCGWMSEFPIETEIIRYAFGVLSAARAADPYHWTGSQEAREGAERASRNRLDPDARTVLETSFKVGREIDRLKGLLRFTPGDKGVYAAHCSPDYFVLPALADHFCRRFAGSPWALIDEKRRLVLLRPMGEEACLLPLDEGQARLHSPESSPCLAPLVRAGESDPWEHLWKRYFKTINNPARENPCLQRRFMPRRYWKYLPEKQ